MRARWIIGAVFAAGALFGLAALAGEPPAPDEATIEGALAEPVDPDEQADLQADQNPDDVGQEALDPAAALPPEPGSDHPLPDVDPDRP
jgi:hypothetical protein